MISSRFLKQIRLPLFCPKTALRTWDDAAACIRLPGEPRIAESFCPQQ